jgi:hypothetical protein
VAEYIKVGRLVTTYEARFDQLAALIQRGRLAQQERDNLIRELRHVEHLPIDQVATLAGLTKQRISQIAPKP